MFVERLTSLILSLFFHYSDIQICGNQKVGVYLKFLYNLKINKKYLHQLEFLQLGKS